MQNKFYIYFFCFVTLLWADPILGQEVPEELFKQANEAYENEDFQTAFETYQKIENQNLYSVELFLNIGNAAYKLNDIPNSVYYYEKGLKINPSHSDLNHNLKLAQEKVIDKNKSQSSSSFSSWLGNIIGFNSDFWAKTAIIFSILGGFFFISYLFLKKLKFRKVLFYLGTTSWIISFLFVMFAYNQGSQINDNSHAIIFEPTIEIKNEPSEISSTAFILHEGSKVKILESNSNWHKISFSDDKVGWIKKESLKKI